MPRPPVGRSEEIDELAAWLAAPDGPRLVALTGDGGIGKTTVAAAVIDDAVLQGWTALRVACTRVEAALPLSGYADVVAAAEQVEPGLLERLDPPQRHAAEVAMQRRHPEGGSLEPLALGLSLRAVLAHLVARGPTLLCVDDLQWLDSDSTAALAFAVRRLPGDRFRVLATLREAAEAPVLRDLHRDDVRLRPLAPLAAEDLATVVQQAVGWEPTEAVLDGLTRTARGNPLFAIELARSLGTSRPVLPPPRWEATAAADDVFAPRLDALGATARDAVLAVALAGDCSPEVVVAVAGGEGLERACRGGVLEIRSGRVVVPHPLIAAVALGRAEPQDRAAVARILEQVLDDPLLGLRSRAATAVAPEASLAAELDAAATAMAERGAMAAATDLAREACRLTPADDAARGARLVRTARLDLASGHPETTIGRLTADWDALGTADLRAEAHLLIGMASPPAEDLARLDRALAEAEAAPIRARILLRKALLLAVGEASELPTAASLVAQAEALPGGLDDPVDRASAATIGCWVEVLRGAGTRRTPADEPTAEMLHEVTVRRPLAVLQAARGEVEQARAAWGALHEEAAAGGQAVSALVFAAHLFELAVRTGDVRAAERWLVEFADLPDSEEPDRVRRRFLADLAAVRGRADEAISCAQAVIDDPESQGWDVVAARRARGVAELAAGRYTDAAATLGAVWRHCAAHGIGEPGVFPVAGDLVEALVATGDLATAREVLAPLAACSADNAWATLTRERGEALLRLAERYADDAARALAAVATRYAEQGLHHDAARTRLSLGRIMRRAGKRAAARSMLAEAEEAFAAGGADGWAGLAAEERAAVSGRRTAEGLTDSEERVARLAAEGLSNREIGRRLMISPHTVETHLSRAYRKLGVSARSQLVHHLA